MENKNLSPKAIELLETTIEVLKVDPSLLNMGTLLALNNSEDFIKVTFDNENKPVVAHTCDSVCCIAGTICAIKETVLDYTSYEMQSLNIEERAAHYLGLATGTTDKLFYSSLTASSYSPKIGTPEYVEATIETIRNFIDSDAKDIGLITLGLEEEKDYE